MIFLAVLSACFAVGSAGARQSAQIVARSTVTALAADGNDVAYAAARTRLDCDRVFIWQRLTGRTFQLGKRQRCAPRAAPVDSVAVSGGRALWLTSTSGKTVNWQLWTATTTKRTPRLAAVRDAAADRSEADPHRLGGRRPSSVRARHHRDGVEVERVAGVHMERGQPRRRARSFGRPRRSGGGAAGDRARRARQDRQRRPLRERSVRGRPGDEGPGRPA